MKSTNTLLVRAVLLGLTLLSPLVSTHTWVEQLSVIAANGTMVGAPGFARGNVLRSNPAFSDTAMVQLIPPNGGTVNVIDPSQLMCRASQTAQSQTDGSPRLSAAPGASVALRYQENGHVSLPQNQPGKPTNRGTNFVYYTTQSQSTDKFLQIHRQWTADGTGGDGRGRLISTQPFDDGQCYQVNGGTISQQRQTQFKHTANNLMGADLWCQQDIKIPADAPAGSTITLYWVWDWPTMPGTAGFPNGKQEIYTTCMDIDIVAGSTGTSKQVAAPQFVKQDFVSAAASSQFVNIANPTAVASPETIAFLGVSGASTNAASTPAAITTANTVQANSNTQPTTTSIVLPSNVPATSNTPAVAVSGTPPFSGQGYPSGHHSGNHHGSAGSEFTVYRTAVVTATTSEGAAPQPVIPQATSVVTILETDMLTVTMTNTVNAKRELHTTTDLAATSASTSSSTACSKTQAAYRLRARSPLYMLPLQDMPGAGC